VTKLIFYIAERSMYSVSRKTGPRNLIHWKEEPTQNYVKTPG